LGKNREEYRARLRNLSKKEDVEELNKQVTVEEE
jgi:hypothetical protein